uniref:Peptidase S1 domain-containing protein n=1 Tax=Anopheles maculatus TaxID=74869 RepID=A0A182T894_9DIPT
MPQGFREDQFCAASSSMDTCEGDSGGPIGVKRYDVGGALTPLVTGVVSFGTPCAAGSTGVYTKVSKYIDWIERATNASYICGKATFCIGRPRETINVNFERIYTQNRFGLLWKDSDGSLWDCGATLIDYQFLLTTASCVTSSKGHPKFVISMSDERATITDVYVSPLYKPGRPENDIALLKIGQYVNHTVYRPACLWDRKTDGEWSFDPKFTAYGTGAYDGLLNETVIVTARDRKECDGTTVPNTDLRCFHNQVPMMPRVCWMDYGGAVIDKSFWGEPVSMYGVVSPLSKDCGSNLYMIDITPHITWIEAIIVGRRDQFLVFSD